MLESAGRRDAAERVRAQRPQVVLLDHALDDGGGLVRDVAGDPELLGVAVILLRPGAGVEDVVAALSAGAVDVWTAEDAAPELIARVRGAYRSRSCWTSRCAATTTWRSSPIATSSPSCPTAAGRRARSTS